MLFVCFPECFILFPGAFYSNLQDFDGAAASVPPPSYSETMAQTPPDPDQPRTPAGPEHSHSPSEMSRPE